MNLTMQGKDPNKFLDFSERLHGDASGLRCCQPHFGAQRCLLPVLRRAIHRHHVKHRTATPTQPALKVYHSTLRQQCSTAAKHLCVSQCDWLCQAEASFTELFLS